MAYEDITPAADKWLMADGSVTTMAGEVILPADPVRAEQYTMMSPAAAKYLLPDGSVVSNLPTSGGGIIVDDAEIDIISNQKISLIIHQVFGG